MSRNHVTSNGTFQRASRSRRWLRFPVAAALLLCAGLVMGIPDAAYADSMGASSISFSNLQFALPTGSAGSIMWQGSWTSQAYADAQNSLGQLDSAFTSNLGTASAVSATVTFANASGSGFVSPLSGTAFGNSSISGVTAQAETIGQGILTNTFEITGGSGVVNVTLSTDLTGEVKAANDAEGVLATAEAAFLVDVNGTPDLFFDSPISVGPSASADAPFCFGSGCSQTLTNTVPLSFNTPYLVYVEADAETSAYNITPEPSAGILSVIALLGIGVYAFGAERRSALRERSSLQKV